MIENRYAKIIDEKTKEVQVGVGCSDEYYLEIGMTLMEVEQAYDSNWYVAGYAPIKPAPTPEEIKEAQISELKALLESSNSKIIECSEYDLVGLELPYNIADLHKEREAIREKIRKLEDK